MTWTEALPDGCSLRALHKHVDGRGWLAEFFRHDELPSERHPAMGYLSMTFPGVVRGPHEHADQTDLFLFFSGTFTLYLWDVREGSPTRGSRLVLDVGEDNPMVVIVPPGVVHAYKNAGTTPALVVNCPNRLYAGYGKAGPVDEIRHEDAPDTMFMID